MAKPIPSQRLSRLFTSLFESERNLVRALGIFLGVLIAGFGFMMPEGAIDPFWERGVLGLGMLGVVLSSFFSAWVMRYFRFLQNLFIALTTLWMSHLVVLNDFAPVFVTGFYALLFTSVMMFQHWRNLLYFSLFNQTLSLVMLLLGDSGTYDAQFFFAMVLFINVVGNLAMGFRIRFQQKLLASQKEELRKRERLEQNLEESNRLYSTVLDLSGVAIVVVDKEGKVADCNRSYADLWGFRQEEILGEAFSEILARCKPQIKNLQEIHSNLEQLMEDERGEDEAIISLRNGKMLHRYTRNFTVAGKIRGRVWFLHDISDLNQTQEELGVRNFELDSFIYRASHDLKAPVNSMTGLVNLALLENENPRLEQFLKLIQTSLERQTEFISNLAQFSKVDRMEIQLEEIDGEALFQEVWNDLRFMDGSEDCQIEWEIRLQDAFVSDKLRLSILLENLVSNAIKYRDPEKEQTRIKLLLEGLDSQVRITVSDNGLGVPEEHQDRIFELFFRASRHSFGSGVGLYNVKNAVRKLGGEISFQSQEGVGSRFEVMLPNHRQQLGEKEGQISEFQKK